MGFDPQRDMCVWDPQAANGLGGCSAAEVEQSTFLLWKGHCSVHMLFKAEHVDQIRREWPGVQVIVHPECDRSVVVKADQSGSTEGILHTVLTSPAGSRWAVGTEVHMVNRLAKEAAPKGIEVRILSGCQCLCTTMYRIDPPHLLWVLDHLSQGQVVNQITVHPLAKKWAKVALERMLQITG